MWHHFSWRCRSTARNPRNQEPCFDIHECDNHWNVHRLPALADAAIFNPTLFRLPTVRCTPNTKDGATSGKRQTHLVSPRTVRYNRDHSTRFSVRLLVTISADVASPAAVSSTRRAKPLHSSPEGRPADESTSVQRGGHGPGLRPNALLVLQPVLAVDGVGLRLSRVLDVGVVQQVLDAE